MFPKPKTKHQSWCFLRLVTARTEFQFLFYGKTSAYFTKIITSPIIWEAPNDIAKEALKQTVKNPHSLGILIIRFPFSCLYMKRKGNALWVLPKSWGINPKGYASQQMDLWPEVPPVLKSLHTLLFWLKSQRKPLCDLLIAYVPHKVDALLNSHLIQYFSASHLTS